MAVKPKDPANRQYTHPPGILVSDHYKEPYGYSCYRAEGTKDWLIMYTLSGRGMIENGGEGVLECTAGDLTIVPPGVRQHYYTAPGEVWEKLWAHFIPRITWMDWIPTSLTGGPIPHIRIGSARTRQAIESAFHRLLSYRLDAFAPLREELTLNALEEIILLVASQNADKKQLDARVKEVLHMLARNYSDDHPIDDLARMVCLSPSRLSHLFKEQTGDSIIETLTHYRLKQAEKLLTYTLRPITDIALGVGFSSPDYFTRQFTSYYGVTPSQFRKRQRTADLPHNE